MNILDKIKDVVSQVEALSQISNNVSICVDVPVKDVNLNISVEQTSLELSLSIVITKKFCKSSEEIRKNYFQTYKDIVDLKQKLDSNFEIYISFLVDEVIDQADKKEINESIINSIRDNLLKSGFKQHGHYWLEKYVDGKNCCVFMQDSNYRVSFEFNDVLDFNNFISKNYLD